MNTRKKDLIICSNAEEVSQRAAELFEQIAVESVQSRGCFTVALSGGTTPKALYSLLAGEPFARRLPWSDLHLFWGDERCVAPDHPKSNYGMARIALLDKVAIPEKNVHRMRGEEASPELAAAEYEQTLRDFFHLLGDEEPRLDLIFLGMGNDGHTASLFPGTGALKETQKLVVANYVARLGAYRITLTPPAINRASYVIFLISGTSKADVLRDVLEGPYDPERLPSQLVCPLDGELVLIADVGASRLTSPRAEQE